VLQCVAVCCTDNSYDLLSLQLAASVVARACCSVLQCVAVCCSDDYANLLSVQLALSSQSAAVGAVLQVRKCQK